MKRMRVLLLAGLASIALGAASSHAQVHVYLPPLPLPSVVFNVPVPPPVVVDVHPVPPPHVYYGPPVRYRYVEHYYHERPRYHHKHKYDRHHRKHHRYDDDD